MRKYCCKKDGPEAMAFCHPYVWSVLTLFYYREAVNMAYYFIFMQSKPNGLYIRTYKYFIMWCSIIECLRGSRGAT